MGMKNRDERDGALRAMERARRIAYERAARHDQKIAVWSDGKLVEIDPKAALHREERVGEDPGFPKPEPSKPPKS
jgi:hypothetical protein